MGREVRRVPPDWQHPRERDGSYRPMYPGDFYRKAVDEWDDECARWKAGWRPDHCDDAESRAMAYEQWAGQRPHQDDYMPEWPSEIATHWQMYEDTTEGTPISPVFADPAELADWLARSRASFFGGTAADRKTWLGVIERRHPGCLVVSVPSQPQRDEPEPAS